MRIAANLLFFILITASVTCPGQQPTAGETTRQKDVQQIVDSIASENELMSEYVGRSPETTRQWTRFEQLEEKATTDEFILLTSHNNAVVRCYAFLALAHDRNADVVPILLQHINDTATVQTFIGCFKGPELVGDYFLDAVGFDHHNSSISKLSPQQLSIVDSILLFDRSIGVRAKDELLQKIQPNPKYYNRIREIAIEEKRAVAVLALARFKNINDTALISSMFLQEETEFYGLYAVREFPHPMFYPLLKKTFEKEWKKKSYDHAKWRLLYQALAQYPSQEIYDMFEQTALTKDKVRYQELGQYARVAIHKYPNPQLKPLITKIKLDQEHFWDFKNLVACDN